MPRICPVITGLGAISAAGCGVLETWKSLRDGRSGLGPLTLFESPRHGRHLVGQVRADVDRLAGAVRGSRSDKLAWIAAREAIQHAGLGANPSAPTAGRIGVFLGSTVAGMLGTEVVLGRLLREQRRRFGALRFHECAAAADLCARQLGWRGPCATFSTACSAGAMAIAAAAEMIENGEADAMLAGGADSLSRLTLNGFGSLLLLDPNGCRPFDVARAGISLGEGAAMLMLEAEEFAQARGARILARLSGWGASCDASHATAPHPQGDGALSALRQAVERSGLRPSDIGYVCAHGTGTPDNDAMEAQALRRLFGDAVPPFSSVKRFLGHTLAASGALKAVVCVQALQEQAVPANPGFENADPQIGLEPVKEFRPQRMAHVLSNSFGFGGNNVVLVFSHPDEPAAGAAQTAQAPWVAASRPRARGKLAVLGAGVVSAAGCALAEVQATFRNGGARPVLFELRAPLGFGPVPVYRCDEFGAQELIPSAKRRRLGHLQQMALVAARRRLTAETLGSVPPERVCAALGTGLGCLGETAAFVENMLVNEERAPLAGRFSNSVHNACASQLAIEFNLRGLNSTPTHREISFEVALWHGAAELRRGQADLALAGAADELNPYLLAAGARWGWWDGKTPALHPFTRELSGRQRPLPGEGAAAFWLANADRAANPLAQVTAIRFGRFAARADGSVDSAAEAEWIRAALEREGLALETVDVLLTGANGWPWLDRMYSEVAESLSRLAGREVRCAAYKQGCGEHHAASAFGFYTALALVRGEIETTHCAVADGPIRSVRTAPRTVLGYTLAPTGTRAMCCVCA